MLKGGCFCGHVRYEAHGEPFHPTVCHCADCRRIVGAPMVAWFSVARGDYRLISGEPARFASSPGVERSFCPRCGTSLTYCAENYPGEIDIALATLDDPEALPPADNTQTGGRLSWAFEIHTLPYRATQPG
ncbi:GFA family protein [Acetobacteraceae bacterium H6797]|nr:GFA family protein [Acetobacteraceae bacterium H6797]